HSAGDATRQLSVRPVDLMVCDSGLADPGAAELARFLKLRQPATRVVLVTRAFSQAELFEAARVGAAAYVRSSLDEALFRATLRRSAAGDFPIDEEVVRHPAVAA